MSDTRAALRVALKSSLWMWALYWPGVGVMLVGAGMRDPASLAVAVASLLSFVALARAGALSSTASRTMGQFVVERPIYLVAASVALLVGGSFIDTVAHLGAALLSALYGASLVLVAVRLRQYLVATGATLLRSRLDQLALLLAIASIGNLLVFLDAVTAGVGNSSATVAAFNWFALAYPTLLLLASRTVREPIRWRRAKEDVAEEPLPMVAVIRTRSPRAAIRAGPPEKPAATTRRAAAASAPK